MPFRYQPIITLAAIEVARRGTVGGACEYTHGTLWSLWRTHGDDLAGQILDACAAELTPAKDGADRLQATAALALLRF